MAVRGTIRYRRWVPLLPSLLLVAIGLVGAKHYVVDVLVAARASWCARPHVEASRDGIAISCAILFLGIVTTSSTAWRWTRARSERRAWDDLFRDPTTRRVTQRGWLIVGTIVAAAFLVSAWVSAHMPWSGNV